MAATIRDVAKQAGCSIKTVSRVINGEPNVTEATRARVQAAIRAVGYAPNISAKRLAKNRSYMICVLIDPAFNQPASGMLTQILEIGYEENYDILIQPYFPPHSHSKSKLVSLIYERRIDGFVITPPLDSDAFVADMLATYKVPQVQINPLNSSKGVPSVMGEDYEGAFNETSYLIELGHRRIAFLKGSSNLRASRDRFRGYQAALQAHQIDYDEGLTVLSEWTFDGGYTSAKLLLNTTDRPSAIFASNDSPAYGVIFAAQEMGISIPGQLSVCGYDNLAFSNQIWPGLTTVHQPSDEMVELATRLLIDLLKGRRTDIKDMTIPSRLVVRGSTGRSGN